MTAEVDINLPVRTVYNQWTQFEEFPHFMDNVDEVRQLDDTTLRWRVTIAGVTREWTAEITEQTPDHRVAWRAVDGTANAGVITFHALDDDTTRVALQLEVDPEGFLETIADKLGFVARQAKADLESFKHYIESRGIESGGFRGTVERQTDGGVPHPNEQAEGESISRRADAADPAGIGTEQSDGVLGERSVHGEGESRVTGNTGRERPMQEAPETPAGSHRDQRR
jgi:uncharacterized protein YndB with AHSA1/START domain